MRIAKANQQTQWKATNVDKTLFRCRRDQTSPEYVDKDAVKISTKRRRASLQRTHHKIQTTIKLINKPVEFQDTLIWADDTRRWVIERGMFWRKKPGSALRLKHSTVLLGRVVFIDDHWKRRLFTLLRHLHCWESMETRKCKVLHYTVVGFPKAS